MSDAPSELLSVIIITRNEEERIGACLDSVFDVCEEIIPYEVVLVDSNSSDRTLEIASQYPMDIYRITREDLTSPATGRAVGAHYARGEYLLFLDGDMRLASGWLDRALELLRERPDLGGVNGRLGPREDAERDGRVEPDECESVEVFRGHGLYDADAYFEAGGFDPAIRGSEDYELCYRLTRAGYDLCRLRVVSVYHEPRTETIGVVDVLANTVRRFRSGYYHGIGQVFRKHLTDPSILRTHAQQHPWVIVHVLWLIGSVLALTAGSIPFIAWVGTTLVALIARSAHVDEPPAVAFWDVAGYAPATVGAILGFLSDTPDDSASFATAHVERVQSVPTQPHGDRS